MGMIFIGSMKLFLREIELNFIRAIFLHDSFVYYKKCFTSLVFLYILDCIYIHMYIFVHEIKKSSSSHPSSIISEKSFLEEGERNIGHSASSQSLLNKT